MSRRHCPTLASAVALVLALVATANAGAAPELPRVHGKPIVASVQGEPITFEEFNRELGAINAQRPADKKLDADGARQLLRRMIYVTLIAQEGRRMGIDKLPEIRQVVDSYAHITLRDELVSRAVQNVKADPKEVEERYRASIREWKVSAVLFTTDEQAQRMAAEVAGGTPFREAAKAYLADGRAAKVEDGIVLKRGVMDPAIARALPGLTTGTISGVVPTKAGPVVLTVDDILYPDDPAARAEAERAALTSKRKEVVVALDRRLRAKYAKIDRELLKRIDYEADKPGFDALLKDRRVLAEIKGEKPITVGEMTDELRFRFFHGVQMAAQRKLLNAKKEQVLDSMVQRQLFRKEALRLKLDKTESYRSKIKQYDRSVIFGAVLYKAIVPDVKFKEHDVKAYYEAHRSDYTTPSMVRIRGLAFADRASAEAAVAGLKRGDDFDWVASRADTKLDADTDGVLSFDGQPIMTTELPEGLPALLAGAKAGDAVLYESPDQRFYALLVENVVAAAPRPYEEVKDQVVKKVLDIEVQKAVARYAEKLWSLSEVKVYLQPS